MGKQPLIEEIYDRTKELTGFKMIKNKSIYDLIMELNHLNEISDLTIKRNKYNGALVNGVNFEISVKKNTIYYDLNLKLS
jgi:hypothetical protein